MTTGTETDVDGPTIREAMEFNWPLEDVKRAIQEAIGPKKAQRRIWIEASGDIEHDGPAGTPESLEMAERIGATMGSDGRWECCARTWSADEAFDLYISVYLRHGWKLEDGYPTATEAHFSKSAA